ncbi:MAG: CHAP domain-containing protein [Hyphomicrobiales bacterium]|nr:MAG: CHAP domain-containing protein [Hyphomicrobiales bacterium]
MTWAALFNTTPVKVKSAGALDAVIAKAASQIGVLEDPPKSNRGKQVEAYLASVGLKGGYAWCAAFVHWCFREAMGDANPCPKSGGVIDLWHQIGAAKKLRLTPAQAKANPGLILPGMLFFLDTGGGFGHVGFVEKVQGIYLTTIEGNTNEGGSRDGVGVFRRKSRTIGQVSLGFADLSRPNA